MKKIYKQISGALLMLTLILNITPARPKASHHPTKPAFRWYRTTKTVSAST